MGRPRKYDSNAERQAAYRDRLRNEEEPVEEPPVTKPAEPERPQTLRGLILEARAGTIVLTEREERAIRHHFGYAESEKRTLLERDATARRIASKTQRVTRVAADGSQVEETLGPAGLSLIAYPTQVAGDLTPTPEQLAKLGETTGSR